MAATYDIVTIGGGLAGASLARAMASNGKRVLVVERETAFRDRVRGEQMASWGVAEARELGVYDLLMQSCGNPMVFWDMYMMQMPLGKRDLTATTASGLPNMGFFHPEMQEQLIRAAADAGAEVRRGAKVTNVEPGRPPRVTIEHEDGHAETVEAGIVAACDGRSSPSRKWGDFTVNHERDRMQIAGLFFENMNIPEDTAVHVINPMKNAHSLLFPSGGGRVRSYVASWKASNPHRLQGDKDVAAYIEESIAIGVPASAYEGATPAGPLATFDGADTWVEHPYREGIALVGDAASASDPNWGQGLSLTLRDVRELRDQLLLHADPDEAGHAYAAAHDVYYGKLRNVEDTYTDLMFMPGDEMSVRRGAVLPKGPAATPELEILQSGPDVVEVPADLRRRMIG
jgi:menaquinone-9 beta-reductase